jgi:hypothetical protein
VERGRGAADARPGADGGNGAVSVAAIRGVDVIAAHEAELDTVRRAGVAVRLCGPDVAEVGRDVEAGSLAVLVAVLSDAVLRFPANAEDRAALAVLLEGVAERDVEDRTRV